MVIVGGPPIKILAIRKVTSAILSEPPLSASPRKTNFVETVAGVNFVGYVAIGEVRSSGAPPIVELSTAPLSPPNARESKVK